MAEMKCWKVIRSVDSDGVLLAVDFPLTGRPEAAFVDLAPNLDGRYSLWQTVPPEVSPGLGISGTDYVDRWAAEIADLGVTVRGVLGFCIGSVYGAALAARIANWQFSPPLVLFDPEPATVDTLYWQYEKMVSNLAVILADTEISTLREHANELRKVAGSDVMPFAVELFKAFEPVAANGFNRYGLELERSNELLQLFASLISYLAAADGLAVEAEWKRAIAITSISEFSDLNPHRSPDGETSGLVAEERQVNVEHSELLRSPEVAETVSGLL
jgi:hypothetical protein